MWENIFFFYNFLKFEVNIWITCFVVQNSNIVLYHIRKGKAQQILIYEKLKSENV